MSPATLDSADFHIKTLGEATVESPLQGLRFVSDTRVLYRYEVERVRASLDDDVAPPSFELAGPRRKIFFDPARLRCGIVTCGGLCPGLNDVIRAIVLALDDLYGVADVVGFRFGYEGLIGDYGHQPLELTAESVDRIHESGGTLLGTSRGPQSAAAMVDTLVERGIGVLFAIGGDGTLRGAHSIAEEIARRGLAISVIGVPKTIDNDISFIETSFGFETAVDAARNATRAAFMEATSAVNGVGVVKVMGRESGYIAAYTALADSHVSLCLVPEVPFTVDSLMKDLEARLHEAGNAVMVVAEGAGQDLVGRTGATDRSGNVVQSDIGPFLCDRIRAHFSVRGLEVNLKYIDPSYIIRGQPANVRDAAFCLGLGHAAVHAALSGRTDMVVGQWHQNLTHVPIPLAVSVRKRLQPEQQLWQTVLASTSMPTLSGAGGPSAVQPPPGRS